MVLPGLMAGLQVDKYSTNVLRIYDGFAFNADGTKKVINSTRYSIDMLTNGIGGLDRGFPASGRQYNVYIVRQECDDAFGAMISAAKYAGPTCPPGGDPDDYVQYPEGWVFHKKLQFGFVWSTAWDGIPDFHVSHWPMPFVRLTKAGYGSPWMAVANQETGGVWTDVDLSGWLPDNARMAYLGAEPRYISGSAGSLYLRSWGGQTVPVLIGSTSPGSPFPGVSFIKIRVDSLRKIQFKTDGNARAFIQVLGYDMTEPA